MKKQSIAYKSINRSIPSQEIQNGWLDEMINIRHFNGRLEPVGDGKKLYNLPSGDYSKIWHHDQNGLSNFVGLDDTNALRLVDMETGSSTLIYQYSEPVLVEFLKRYMIVSTSDDMHIFLWRDDSYNLMLMPGTPMFTPYIQDKTLVQTEETTGAKSILGKYFKKVNSESHSNNKHTGTLLIRAAYRMYDGSYVKHSIPVVVDLGNQMIMTEKQVEGDGEENDPNSIKFYVSELWMNIQSSYLSSVDKDLFSHIVFFATKTEELYEMSEDVLTDDLIKTKVKNIGTSGDYEVDFKDIYEDVNPDYKKLAQSVNWYKILEVGIDEILDNNEYVKEIDMKGFYQTYATNETLPVDQFSYHKTVGANSFNYNSRLILGDIKTIFGEYQYFPLNASTLGFSDGSYFPPGYVSDGTIPCQFLVTLKTSQGEIVKLIDAGARPMAKQTGLMRYVTVATSILGYPDARASKIELLVQRDGNWYKSGASWNMKKYEAGNFAFYHDEDFNVDSSDTYESNYPYIIAEFPLSLLINPVTLSNYDDVALLNESMVKISELDNPFVFPAKNSYEIGTGTVLATRSNTEPLSTGQFGEFPLIVFTSKGTWTMLQGTGEVLFSSVHPLNRDVPTSVNNIIQITNGVVYMTNRGLFLLTGREKTSLSAILDGMPNTAIQQNSNFIHLTNIVDLANISAYISTTNDHLLKVNSNIGFNKQSSELIVSNPEQTYSLVYSFESGGWHKINKTYKLFINSYPKLLGLSTTTGLEGVYNLSDEQYENEKPILLLTRPVKLESSEGDVLFSLIHRVVQRCEVETAENTFAGLYIFGSNDMRIWQLLQGNDKKTGKVTDILCTRSHLKLKYFVFMLIGTFTPESIVSVLNVQFYSKLDRKLR